MGMILIIIAVFVGFVGVGALFFGIAGVKEAKDEAAKSAAMKRAVFGGAGTVLAIMLFFAGTTFS